MEYIHDAIETLHEMISRPSFSREETEVADYLQQRWENDGWSVRRLGNNLWIPSLSFSDEKKTILLNSHIDTVRPAAGWSIDPFSPIEDGDRLSGLGSNDAGASVVSLYAAFRTLCEKEQPFNLIFLASCEEEVSGKGGVEFVLQQLPDVDFAVVGEPTQMNPAIAEKGLMVLDCCSHGQAGHAARNEGVNAIAKAAKAIEWFHNYRFPQKDGLLGEVKMTVTVIESGTQHNVVPDRCKFTVDVRTNEYYSNAEILEILKQEAPCEEIEPRSLRLNSSRIDENHPMIERCKMLGKKPFGSPTLSDQALMPFPSVKIGPGDSARSHTADEFILCSEINEAVAIYVRLLDQLSF